MQAVGISAGSVEYSAEVAAVDIDEMIEALENARNDGATHVVGFSGNYRGAQYVRLGTNFEWLESEDDEYDEYDEIEVDGVVVAESRHV